MPAELPNTSWALLNIVKRADSGGPKLPPGFEKELAELHAAGLIADDHSALTAAGEAFLHEEYKNRS